MKAKDSTTRKWVAKFCEVMDWFLRLEKVHGDNLMEAHIKGLAANYLAVKLGVFDPATSADAPDLLDREPPCRRGDWECDYPEIPGYQQIREWRLERMTHWKDKAEKHAKFKRTVLRKEVTEDNIRRYCDCLKSIMYHRKGGSWQADITEFALEANDLAVKLGFTHPDWILAMELGLLTFSEAPAIRELPLPWKYDKPPVIFQNVPVTVGKMGNAALADLEKSIKKAQSLRPSETTENRENVSAAQEIPPEYKSAPLSLKRMAVLWGGDMTPKKLRAMIDNHRIRFENINRQTFVFDTRDLPTYAVEDARR